MPTTEAIKVLGQVAGTASVGTYTLVYSCPTSTSTVVSTISICNTASTTATYRLALSTSSSTPTQAEHLVYGASVPANDSVFLTLGICATSTQKFLVASSSASTVSFGAFGVESVTT